MMMNEIRIALEALSDEDYRLFSHKLNPGVEPVLGVRVPAVRSLAREVAARDNWREVVEVLLAQPVDNLSMEERMVCGMVPAFVREMSCEERLEWLARFVPLINCWAVCDTVCSTYHRFVSREMERVYNFLLPYLHAASPYEVRFGVVMLMDNYVEPLYIDRLLELYNGVRVPHYYVQMGVAWALSVCYVKFPARTYAFLSRQSLDSFTHNKTLQKVCESYRVTSQEKDRIRALKRK